MIAAATIAAVGCGFVIFAAFSGLRLLLGPELAALGVGTLLLALAALLARSSSVPDDQVQTEASEPLPPTNPTAPPQPSDPATLAVFTAAFVLGRRLADRWRE
jgi:multisubunit Na+/H+ antiporter MnhC subunit